MTDQLGVVLLHRIKPFMSSEATRCVPRAAVVPPERATTTNTYTHPPPTHLHTGQLGTLTSDNGWGETCSTSRSRVPLDRSLQ
ncbi:hypothetical protein EYF80_043187 [Liparis tanakae]|uniref:Uncharacterized protein n=1 Tax=Liparis tanakae TaxID=230148 RepID=A0A4Z2G0A9_9TELE|nr:hypothetical protein EYF80_043187 [Liparis tanakae]